MKIINYLDEKTQLLLLIHHLVCHENCPIECKSHPIRPPDKFSVALKKYIEKYCDDTVSLFEALL